MPMDDRVQENLGTIISRIKEVRNIDLGGYRPAMIKRRLTSRMNKLEIEDTGTYLEMLQNPVECDALIDEIGINVSSFFRDPQVFEIIEHQVLPSIIAAKRATKSREIRIWSVGCAAGEEPYSIAILLHKILKNEDDEWTPYIFATDIDYEALENAATAVYSRKNLENTKISVLDNYFIKRETTIPLDEHKRIYEVRPFIKKMVRFSLRDCTSTGVIVPKDSIFATFDIVLCRNVIIYFTKKQKYEVLGKLSNAVIPGGYLVLGEAGILEGKAFSQFKSHDYKKNICRRVK
ncbi:MAG: protein-glutamate O-methyltransferase CheR [bacterium]|nr:protein-glutamate O-methyltransferase CheR [bacterium]